MTVKYLDPWKDDKYGKLKGDKADSFFKVVFDEAEIHKTDDCYILAGNITEYQGIVRAFKPENPLNAGFCAVPIYGSQYEIRRKEKDGTWVSDKIEPSVFEKELYQLISADEDKFMPHDSGLSGFITHLPNAMTQTLVGDALTQTINSNVSVTPVDLSGKLPDYSVPKSGGQRRSFGGGYKGLTPDDKIAFIVKQMELDVKSPIHKQGQNLAELTDQIIREHADNENFLSIYFDLLIACVK